MRGLNKVTLIGNVGKAPDVKILEDKVKVAKCSLATTETYKDGPYSTRSLQQIFHRAKEKSKIRQDAARKA